MTADFTSASFLGIRHPHAALAPWGCLTTGRPPALDTDGPSHQWTEGPGAGGPDHPITDGDGGGATAGALVGQPAALVRRSALHALIDVVNALAPDGATVLVDAAAYPVTTWAVAVASLRRVTMVTYRHHDADHAAQLWHRHRPAVVLTDGWCPSCSRPAPLGALTDLVGDEPGRLVIDDSLAVGVLGRRDPIGAGAGVEFGRGGAGTPAWLGLTRPGPVVVASLAKALGTPLALIAGPRAILCAIDRASLTTVHTSGPSAADRAALRAVVATPPHRLDGRRHHLAQLTDLLRTLLRRHGLRPAGLPFPYVQAGGHPDPAALVAGLRRRGCRVVLTAPRCGRATAPALGIAVTADHHPGHLRLLHQALAAGPP